MARPASDHPTELELQILKILWKDSPLAVRQIRRQLAESGRELAHTSVITTLNIMVRKQYLDRARQGNAFLFTPRVTKESTSRGILDDVVTRVFDGSASATVLSLFESGDIDESELKELRRLINRKLREQSE